MIDAFLSFTPDSAAGSELGIARTRHLSAYLHLSYVRTAEVMVIVGCCREDYVVSTTITKAEAHGTETTRAKNFTLNRTSSMEIFDTSMPV
jgi:hypothetical protein